LVASGVALIAHHLGGRVEAQPPPVPAVIRAPHRPPVAPPAPLHLDVRVVPAGAEVRLDGERACAAPCSLALPVGRPSVQVTAGAPGFVEETRAVDAQSPPGELRFTLKRVHRPHPPKVRKNKNSTVDPFTGR
jgi:hypothetical protein